MNFKVLVLLLICVLSSVLNLAKAAPSGVCSLPLETGMCKAYFESWGYDPSINECVRFIYGGCRGNGNRFGTKEKCMEVCEKY